MKTGILLFFSLFLLIKVNAQNSLNGTVTDRQTGETLPGVNIVIPELSSGTFTNAKGVYHLNDLPKGSFLVRFSFVGYETVVKKIALTGTPVTINVKLKTQVVQGEEVIVTGSFTETQHENTIKIDALNAKNIADNASPSFMNTLVSVPGVAMISKGPGVATPVIRGLSTSNVLLLNNGIPMENFQFSEDHPYMIDASGVGHIEIIKGPASLLYGSGAVAGVINVLPEPVASEGHIEGDATLKFFSNTAGTSSSLGIKGNRNGWVWGVRGAANSNRDYLQGNGEFAPNTRFNRNSVKANVGLIKKIGFFRIFYNHNRAKLGMAVPPAFSLVNGGERKNSVWYQNLTSNMVTSHNKIFFGKSKVEVLLAYQQNRRMLQGSALTPVPTLVDMNLKTLSYKVKSNYDLSDNSHFIVGIQGMWQHNKNGEAPNHIIPDASIADFSVFGLARQRFGSLLNVEAGVRYDHRNLQVPQQNNLDLLNRQYGNVSASIGATVNLSNHTILRLHFASAYRNPNLAELTENGMHGVRYEVGNRDLKNQKNMEADLGIHKHTRHATFDLSLFYNNIDDYIYFSPTNDTSAQGFKIYRYEQSTARLYGGEATVHVHPHPLDWLHLKASYAYLVGEKIAGGSLPLIPANKLHGEIMVRKNRWKRLRETFAKLSYDYTFAQNNPSEFETASAAYSLLNFSLGTDIQVNSKRMIRVSLMATNLLNTIYVDHLSTLQDVGLYNMGRNVTLSVKIPFGMTRKR